MATEKFSQFSQQGLAYVGGTVVGLSNDLVPVNAIFDFPGTGILDRNKSTLVRWVQPDAGVAVNYVQISNAISGTPAILAANGSDINISLNLVSKGAGNILASPGVGGYFQAVGNGAAIFPAGTTSQRPVTGIAGMFRYNTDSGLLEFYNSMTATWTSISTGGGTVTSVTGTMGRITSTGGTTPVIDISAFYVGQPSITTVGTITAGTWNGAVVSPVYGGTGINNGASTLTLAGSLQTIGAFSSMFTMTANTNVTFPASGTLSTTTGTVTSVVGTANRITSTGGTDPIIDIAANYVGQSSITTLGTITTGVWDGTVISPAFGGTGVNNGVKTITLGGTLATAGAFPATLTFIGATNVTFPTSGTLSTTTGTVTSVSGTLNRIAVANGSTAAIVDIDSNYAGQSSINTLGTVSTGDWQADIISPAFGGTGFNNGSNTLMLGGTLSTSGPYAAVLTFTGTTNVTFPTSGVLSTTVGTVTSVNGTAGQIVSTGGSDPIIGIDPTYIGQASITTIGTITTGIWNGTIISPIYGGTGVNNGTSTLAITGGFASTFNMTGITNVTFPTSGTLSTTVGTVTSVSGTAGEISSTGGADPILGLIDTSVTAGSYSYASLSVDSKGRLTSASSNTPIISITGTANQITATTVSQVTTLSFPAAVIFPGTVTLNADPVTPLQAATKQYVDSIGAGFSFIQACYAATTTNLSATYNNGASGVGATLTNNGAQVVFSTDGTTPALNARILVKDQTTSAYNGVYVLSNVGSPSTNWVLTRATDYDSTTDIKPGNFIIVSMGTLYSNTAWIQSDTVTTVGTDPIDFTQFGNTAIAVTSVSGTTNRITSTGGTTPIIDIDAAYVGQSSIITLGTVTAGTWNSTVIAPSFGGTGINNGAKTITLGGNLATAGAFNSTFTMTGATNVTFPTSGTLSTTVGTVTSVSGTLNRITSTGGATPAIDIDVNYIGQASINTLGTISTGTWNADIISPIYGGTGVNNGGNTITLAQDLSTAGAFPATFTFTGNTNVTFPTSGLLSTTVGTVTSVSGTAGQIISTGGATPIISIDPTYAGQPSIITVGTITTGTWHGAIVSPIYGGTGINNGSNTLTLANPLATVGAFPVTFNFTASTNVTFPVSGTLSTTTGTVTSVNGTANQIDSTGGNNPIISISSTYAGQTSIVTVGTISSGTWNADIIAPAYGGTGINNGSNTLTLAANLATSGAFPATFTFTGNTSVTFPTSGTLSTTVGTVTSVSGTTNRITVATGTTTPVIDISAAYIGQTSITTLGTISTGAWNSTLISPAFGGTGINNGVNTLTLAGTLATAGAFATTLNFTGPTNVTFPTSGTLSTTTGTVTSVNGTLNRITSTGGANPVIDIDSGYVGQASIVTVGTITSGTWNGSIVSPAFGGTGINNGVKTITLGGNLTTSGAFNSTFVMTAATNVTFPTSGTLATTAGTVASVSGTLNRITSTGGINPVIDIDAGYIGQSSITTVGTLSFGAWQAMAISPTYGGTGVNNGVKTITLGGSLTTSGAFASTFTMTGTTNVTFPTSGTLSTTVGTVTSVTGTANRITVATGTTTPVIDIAATYIGQSSITTVGTITAGTWNGTIVSPVYGGTGVNNGASTLTLGGSHTLTGAFTSTFNITAATNVTFPTSGTLLSTVNPMFDACTGRLTLTSNTPVTTADVTGAATIYFTPYKGSYITIYDGTNWNLYTFTQLSVAVPAGSVGAMYDVFITATAGVLSLSVTAWTNGTTRATGLVFQNGVYVKSGATSQRYLGSFALKTSGATEDSIANRYLYNYYNRVKKPMGVIATTSWTYASATIRQANASSVNQLNFCIGVVEDVVEGSVSTLALAGGLLGAVGLVAIGLNSTTAAVATSAYGAQELGTSGDFYFLMSQVSTLPGLGLNYLSWLEATTSSSATYGNTGTGKSGIIGNLWA